MTALEILWVFGQLFRRGTGMTLDRRNDMSMVSPAMSSPPPPPRGIILVIEIY